jgi:hypothetical protein
VKILSKLLSVEGLGNLPEQLDRLFVARKGWFCIVLENMENDRAVRAVAQLCIINKQERRAGVVQWQYRSFPSFGHGFDSRRPLQILKHLRSIS